MKNTLQQLLAASLLLAVTSTNATEYVPCPAYVECFELTDETPVPNNIWTQTTTTDVVYSDIQIAQFDSNDLNYLSSEVVEDIADYVHGKNNVIVTIYGRAGDIADYRRPELLREALQLLGVDATAVLFIERGDPKYFNNSKLAQYFAPGVDLFVSVIEITHDTLTPVIAVR